MRLDNQSQICQLGRAPLEYSMHCAAVTGIHLQKISILEVPVVAIDPYQEDKNS
jgi:hypothetical protein